MHLANQYDRTSDIVHQAVRGIACLLPLLDVPLPESNGSFNCLSPVGDATICQLPAPEQIRTSTNAFFVRCLSPSDVECVLLMLMMCLSRSDNQLVQLQAVRSLAAMAAHERFRCAIVANALQDLLGFAVERYGCVW